MKTLRKKIKTVLEYITDYLIKVSESSKERKYKYNSLSCGHVRNFYAVQIGDKAILANSDRREVVAKGLAKQFRNNPDAQKFEPDTKLLLVKISENCTTLLPYYYDGWNGHIGTVKVATPPGQRW